MARLSIVLFIFIFAGCASDPKDIGTAYVSPLIYKNYDCDQLVMEGDRISRRTQQLHASLKKTADDDAAQMTVGMLLLWPTLFWLEGGDGPEAQEYARLKGENDALQQAAIQRNCQSSLIPNAMAEIEKAEKKKAEEQKKAEAESDCAADTSC